MGWEPWRQVILCGKDGEEIIESVGSVEAARVEAVEVGVIEVEAVEVEVVREREQSNG